MLLFKEIMKTISLKVLDDQLLKALKMYEVMNIVIIL